MVCSPETGSCPAAGLDNTCWALICSALTIKEKFRVNALSKSFYARRLPYNTLSWTSLLDFSVPENQALFRPRSTMKSLANYQVELCAVCTSALCVTCAACAVRCWQYCAVATAVSLCCCVAAVSRLSCHCTAMSLC